MSNTTRCDVCKAVMGDNELVGFSKGLGRVPGKQHKKTRFHEDTVHIYLSVDSKHDVCAKCQREIAGLLHGGK